MRIQTVHRSMLGILLLAAASAELVACKNDAAKEKPTPQCPTCVTADARGFTPSQLTVQKSAGGKTSLTFTRTSDETCATEVVFPDLGIKKPLPLNASVAVEVPADKEQTYTFQCGMGMYKSALVVK